MNIKLIALDMDGTLLDADHVTIPPRNVAALRDAAERGATVVLATGRTMCIMEEPLATLGVARYAIVSNGACLLDLRTGEWLRKLTVPHDQCKAILALLKRLDLCVEVYADGCSFLTQRDLNGAGALGFAAAFTPYFLKHINLVEDIAIAVEGMAVEKIHVFHIDQDRREALLAGLGEIGDVTIANAEPTNLEITAPGADKGETLAFLCEKLGIAPEEVMAFGDGDNDLGMLAWAGQSFAMENGSDNTKAAAKHVAPSNSASGVGRMIERYVLGR